MNRKSRITRERQRQLERSAQGVQEIAILGHALDRYQGHLTVEGALALWTPSHAEFRKALDDCAATSVKTLRASTEDAQIRLDGRGRARMGAIQAICSRVTTKPVIETGYSDLYAASDAIKAVPRSLHRLLRDLS